MPEQVDAGDPDAVAALAKKHGVDIICNLCAPNFNPPLLQAALKARTHYLDTAMTLSEPHPTDPMHKCGVKLGDGEYALSPEFEKIGKYALAGFGVEPGMADFFARYAADHLFDEIDEIGIRDGSNLEIPGAKGISFGFSVWTTIEECNNPAIVFENGEVHTIEPFAELEKFWLPEGIGEVEVGHVEHEEVIQIAHNADRLKGVKKATFKYALGDEFMQAMEVFRSVNIDKKDKIKVGDVMVAPRDVVAAAAPDPNEIGKKYVGQTAAGTYVTGKKDGKERKVYLYQVADNQECVEKYGTQVVVAQTAFTPGHHPGAARQRQPRQQAGRPQERRAQPRGLQRRRLRRPHARLRVPRRPSRDGVRVQARQGPPGAARPGEVKPPRAARRPGRRPAMKAPGPWPAALPRAAGHNSFGGAARCRCVVRAAPRSVRRYASLRSGSRSGDRRGLQNRLRGSAPVLGGFDSHVAPPSLFARDLMCGFGTCFPLWLRQVRFTLGRGSGTCAEVSPRAARQLRAALPSRTCPRIRLPTESIVEEGSCRTHRPPQRRVSPECSRAGPCGSSPRARRRRSRAGSACRRYAGPSRRPCEAEYA